MHERCAAGCETALQHEGIPRGDKHLGDRRRVNERHATRRTHGLSGGDGEIFGIGATRDDAHHAVARLEARGSVRGRGERRGSAGRRGCGDDFAGKLHARNIVRARKRVRIQPAALQQVGAVECGGVHANEQFVGSRYGHRHVGEAQHLGPTKLGEHDGPHRGRHGAGRHGAGSHRYQALAIFSCRRRSIAERNSSVVNHFVSFEMSAARSLVMSPASTVSMHTCSRVLANSVTFGVPSSLPRCARPRVHAKIDAIGLVLVFFPFWWSR